LQLGIYGFCRARHHFLKAYAPPEEKIGFFRRGQRIGFAGQRECERGKYAGAYGNQGRDNLERTARPAKSRCGAAVLKNSVNESSFSQRSWPTVRSKKYNIRNLFLAPQFLLLFSIAYSQTSEPVPVPTPANETTGSATAPADAASNNPKPLKGAAVTVPEDLIHYGDLVEIDVIGSLEYDWQGKINPEGFLPELAFASDPVFALCQSEDDVAQRIAAAYSKYLRNPQVSVRILDRSDRPVAKLFGAVKTPTGFQIKRSVRLNELVILAGGIADNASGEIQVFRPAKLSCENEKAPGTEGAASESGSRYINVRITDLIAGKPEANPVIRSGDVVTVQEAAVIYLIGGVNDPQRIFARQQMTVSRAIAAAGGAVKGADTKKIVIYRRKNNETTTIEVDLARIEAKQAEDIVLQAFDIIEVPQAGRESKKRTPAINADNFSNGILPLVIVD
jgi:polysaccharide export outer membrane protein